MDPTDANPLEPSSPHSISPAASAALAPAGTAATELPTWPAASTQEAPSSALPSAFSTTPSMPSSPSTLQSLIQLRLPIIGFQTLRHDDDLPAHHRERHSSSLSAPASPLSSKATPLNPMEASTAMQNTFPLAGRWSSATPFPSSPGPTLYPGSSPEMSHPSTTHHDQSPSPNSDYYFTGNSSASSVPFGAATTRSNSTSSRSSSTHAFFEPTTGEWLTDPDHIQAVLTRGMRMIKYPNKASSRPEERVIKVDLYPLQVTWESKKKKPARSSADFHSIREIRLGQNTKAFELHGKRSDIEERAFSVIYSTATGEYKMLNLVAPTKEDCSLWVAGLHMLLARQDVIEGEEVLMHRSVGAWLKKMWWEVDKDRLGQLDLDGVTSLMMKLNVRLSRVEVKSTFKSADISKRGFLSFPAFERLYRALRFRPEIGALFSCLATSSASHLTFVEFERFLVNIQKANWTKARTEEIYKKYSSEEDIMDMDHFSAFLLSANNSNFRKLHTSVYQDMNRPLCDYFISSSHNTYLLGDQVTGESSVEGYIRALQKGCRCLELDCFDGPQGPLIYHKHTLTNRISFKEVIEVISRYAFVSSNYPLFLSLETHCSPDQQAMMATIMIESFGERLFREPLPSNQAILPSPAALMNKIIIKGKVVPPDHSSIADPEGGFETEDDDGHSGYVTPLGPVDLSPSSSPVQTRAPTQLARKSITNSAASFIAEASTSNSATRPSFYVVSSASSNASVPPTVLSHLLPPSVEQGPETLKQDGTLAPADTRALSTANSAVSYKSGIEASYTSHSRLERISGELIEGGHVSPISVQHAFERASVEDLQKKRAALKKAAGLQNPAVGVIAKDTAGKDKQKKHPVENTLSDLVVLCKAVKFTGVHVFDTMRCNQMCSISENKALPLLLRKGAHRDTPSSSAANSRPSSPTMTSPPNSLSPKPVQALSELTIHCQTHLNRIYPAAYRLNSSNFDPIPFWAVGSQMVALNFQTYDRSMQLNQALFSGNGGCGFYLKPPSIRNPTTILAMPPSGRNSIRRRAASRVGVVGFDEFFPRTESEEPAASAFKDSPSSCLPADGGTVLSVGDSAGQATMNWNTRRRVRRSISVSEGLAALEALAASSGTLAFNSPLPSPILNPSVAPPSAATTAATAAGASGGSAFLVDRLPHLEIPLGDTDPNFSRPVVLTITIISAQQLKKPKDDSSSTTSVISGPFVEIEIAGVDAADNSKGRTRNSALTGFNPTWKETFQFQVSIPDMAFLRLQVFDGDARKLAPEVVGSYAIALCNLEQGYRHVPLYNRRGEVIRFCTLFLYISFSTPGAGNNSAPVPTA